MTWFSSLSTSQSSRRPLSICLSPKCFPYTARTYRHYLSTGQGLYRHRFIELQRKPLKVKHDALEIHMVPCPLSKALIHLGCHWGKQGELACIQALRAVANLPRFVGVLDQSVPSVYSHSDLRLVPFVRLRNPEAGLAAPLDALPRF